ncbi:MAG: chromophore lyase CpcT/CpeT [Rhodospirillaceae bacterium]
MSLRTHHRARIFALAALGATLGSALTTTPVQAQSPLEQDLAQIMAWWPGTYNNDKQVAEVEARMGEDNFTGEVWRVDNSGMGGYLNVTSHYARIDFPALGENVLYVEEYRDGNPDETYRQRIYNLTIDDEEAVIRVNLINFKDREKYIGAYKDLSMLDNLTPDDISPFPEICDLMVEQRGNAYHMPMKTNACAFGGQAFSYEAVITGDAFWFRDKIVRLDDGTVVMTMANFNFHKLDRLQ